MFPGDPIEADNSSAGLSGRKFTLTTSAYYFAGYQDMSSSAAAEFEKQVELQKQLFDKIRDGTRDAIQSRTKINLFEEAHISINGFPGRSSKIRTENGSVWRQHAYLVEKRIYTKR